MHKLYAWLAVVGATLICDMPRAWPGIGDYPLHLTVQTTGQNKRLIAHNQGASPITLHLEAGLPGPEDDSEGRTYVIEPRSAANLGDVSEADGTMSYSFYVGRIDAEPDPQRCYRLPFPDGRTFLISQAYGGRVTSHDNDQNRYAVDFSMPEGTPIVASRRGVVVDATLRHRASGRDPSFLRKANRVTIVHDDGTIAEYAHLSPEPPMVRRGERIEAGTTIGHSGNTGYSSGPHLHFVVSRPSVTGGKVKPLSIPFCFYTGKPAVTFIPAVGMAPLAEYRQPGLAAKPAVTAASRGIAQRE